jgi:hypothetical protein
LPKLNESTFTLLDDDDGHDHSVDTQDTSHDHWHHRLHDEFGLEDTHGADTNACLGASVGGAQIYVRLIVLAKTSAEATPMKPKK